MFETINDIKPEKNDSRMLGALAYAGAIIIGVFAPLLIYLLAKDDKFARFHGLQMLLTEIILLTVCMVVFMVGWIAWMLMFFMFPIGASTMPGDGAVFGLLFFVIFIIFFLIMIIFMLAGFLWLLLKIYLAYLAYQGKAFRLPFVTKFVLKNI
ncbi:hypothetical protein BEH94_10800 [Candidatus Altiarchaeales archaeon WOR_SM1_SCG]|nr:hypothetical protein BEH94_10800 [Candidatus Altiarchaeales archaeon WOR_SM1_SCG]